MEEIVGHFKIYVNAGNLEACQSYFAELHAEYEDLPLDYLFQKVYIHACLKKQVAIVDWLMEMYETLDPIQKIAIRQVFSYGRHLLKR
jgi:hypothetical protein